MPGSRVTPMSVRARARVAGRTLPGRARTAAPYPPTPLSLLSSPHKFRQRALNQQHPLQSDLRSLQSQQSRGVQPLSCGTLTRKKRLHVWLRYTLWKMP